MTSFPNQLYLEKEHIPTLLVESVEVKWPQMPSLFLLPSMRTVALQCLIVSLSTDIKWLTFNL
jgi:hypothetical protein